MKSKKMSFAGLSGWGFIGCLLFGLCSVTRGAPGEKLYDIDFSQPFHTPGNPATEDLGSRPRQGPSQNSFNTPIVVSEHGPLTDGALRFEVDGSSLSVLSQIELAIESPFRGLGVEFSTYRLDFDVVIDSLVSAADDFTIFFDSPQANRFNFRGDGLIQYGGGANFIGTFEEDTLIHVTVKYTGPEKMWSITVNDDVLYSGPTIFSHDELRTIRLSLSDQFDLGSVVYVDNIVIVPEPATLGMVGIAALAMLRPRRVSPRLRG